MGHFGGKNCGHELIPLAEYAEKDMVETQKMFEEYKEKIIKAMGIPREYLEPEEFNPRDYMGLPPPVSPTEIMEPPSPDPVKVGDYTTPPPTEIPSFEKWALPIIRSVYPKMVAEPRVYPQDYSTSPPKEINIKLTSTT